MSKYLSLIACLFLFGCAAPLAVGPMYPSESLMQSLAATGGLKDAVDVTNVTVPEKFNQSDIGTIDSQLLRGVLVGTLATAGYQNTAPGEIGKYSFEAALVELSTPLFGFDLDAKCNIHYKLTREKDGTVLLDETVTQGYLASFAEAFNATERARIAQSKAVGENVTHMLRILNKIDQEEAPKRQTNRRRAS